MEPDAYVPEPRHGVNLSASLAIHGVPRDLAMRLHRTLARKNLGSLVGDRAVARRLIDEVPF